MNFNTTVLLKFLIRNQPILEEILKKHFETPIDKERERVKKYGHTLGGFEKSSNEIGEIWLHGNVIAGLLDHIDNMKDAEKELVEDIESNVLRNAL